MADFRDETLAWRVAGGVGVATGLLLAGAFAASITLAHGSPIPVRSANSAELTSMLLTVRQMPTGWSVYDAGSSSSTIGPGCLRQITAAKSNRTAHATVTFVGSKSALLPQFSEGLSIYAIPVSRVFETLVTEFDRCHKISATSGGYKLTGTLGAMSFPRLGDQSAAWTWNFTVKHIGFGDDFVFVRKGAILVAFADAAVGSPDLGQFQRLVREALARVPG